MNSMDALLLKEMVNEMSIQDRLIVCMIYAEELTVQEAAAVLETTEDFVDLRLNSIRSFVAERVGSKSAA